MKQQGLFFRFDKIFGIISSYFNGIKMNVIVKMKYIKFILISFTLIFFSCSEENIAPDFISQGLYEGFYFPSTSWKYCNPEEVGVNSKLLSEAHLYISNPDFATDGYAIIKDGYIIAEDYFGNFSINTKHKSYSIAKSFTSATIGIAIEKGFINDVDDKIPEYYTKLNNDNVQQWKKDITISNLLTMTSGIEWSESGVLTNDIFQMSISDDFVEYVLNKQVINEPGTIWSYNSGESMLLSGIINITTGMSMLEFASENLLEPIGIVNLEWNSDSENHTIAGWGINATVHDYARFGYLYLNNGAWEGTQIISEEWINSSLTPFKNDIPFYGYLWWLTDETFSNSSVNLPDDIFMAIGALGQYLVIVPSENLIIVRIGQDFYNENSWQPEEFIRLVLNAI
ncbi:MAG: beta-lactamase family protein [Bacteroidales bacterium]|nr:beta-lactamase family protein [Bacteroidales bacterium]